MSKILVIPDSHLKAFIFDDADALLEKDSADYAVCLMDIPDDWNQQFNLDLYDFMFKTVKEFQKKHPDTLWCYGNHDCSYLFRKKESGYSDSAAGLVSMRLNELIRKIPEGNINYLFRRDRLIFSHGGLTVPFVHDFVPEELWNDIDATIEYVNNLAPGLIWNDISPIWARPQYGKIPLWMKDQYVHVVGHTPVEHVYERYGAVSTDVYSTTPDMMPIGNQKMIIIDSETAEWNYAD